MGCYQYHRKEQRAVFSIELHPKGAEEHYNLTAHGRLEEHQRAQSSASTQMHVLVSVASIRTNLNYQGNIYANNQPSDPKGACEGSVVVSCFFGGFFWVFFAILTSTCRSQSDQVAT